MFKKLFFVLLFLTGFQSAFCQESSDNSLYNWFDSEIGKNNLNVNNGRLFNDIYRTNKNTNRYYEDENFLIGEVEFDNQYYSSVCINYDLLEDAVLIKPNCEKDRNALLLIKERNKSFVFKGKKFVNLSYNDSQKTENVTGYYEEVISNDLIKFYIKHKKTKRDVYVESSILYEYDLRNEFCVFVKNSFHKVDSKNSISKLFPELKSQINDFFRKNDQLQEDNKVLFMKNLFNYINGLQ